MDNQVATGVPTTAGLTRDIDSKCRSHVGTMNHSSPRVQTSHSERSTSTETRLLAWLPADLSTGIGECLPTIGTW